MLYFLTRDASGTWEHWQASLEPICDFNGDGQVDGEDLLCIVGHWGTDEPLCDIGPFAWGDGTVDLQDLIVLAEHLGKEVTDPSLIAHWPLDETDGITARERVSGSDDVVMGGAIWHPADGIVDGALELDGADDCIITGFGLNPADPEMSSGFCIFAWIKGGGPGQTVLSEPMGASWLMTDTEGKLMTELAGAADTPLLSDAIITDGQWHRVGLAWDGSRRALCVDGFVVAEDAQDGLAGFNSGFYIGVGNDYAADTFFSGLIDDVRIYNRAVHP
ncbi:MAG: hypothetical protein AMJ65_12755 [Phycisphaerae bacterium SG8_4]|nr:MAG: hypothetical protein AMJ65_12755 [Phycisphaerae bacterium SG8_4]